VGHSFDMQHRTRATIWTAVALVGFCLLDACGPSNSAKQTADKVANVKVTTPAQDASLKRYNLTGRVVSIDKANQSINIDGDEIPGFMAAMTMPYQVKDAGALEKLSPGDQIKAVIVVASDGAYLENIVHVQKAASPKPK
jgi:protein SCO1/2